MHPAPLALAKAPRMPSKPRVLQCGRAALSAAHRPFERDNLKTDSFRVRETKFIQAVEGEAVLLVGHAIQAPRTQPVTRRGRGRTFAAALNIRIDNTQLDHINFWRSFHAEQSLLRRPITAKISLRHCALSSALT